MVSPVILVVLLKKQEKKNDRTAYLELTESQLLTIQVI